MDEYAVLRKKCKDLRFKALSCLGNPEVMGFVAKYAELCDPESVFVRTDTEDDAEYIRRRAVQLNEEGELKMSGHTFHFDGFHDQARDKENTKFLVRAGMNLGKGINCIPEEDGMDEMNRLLEGVMRGKEMFVLFLCLGPLDSKFSIYAVQLTDSSYVAHSEEILFRPAYEVFRKKKGLSFFKYVHSAGELDGSVSKRVEKRRIYVDISSNTVYSVNTQYAGNTVGLKKLSLRLAIRKADREGWLAEHMCVFAVHDGKGGKSYLAGAFPSFCGKTSTCMVEGETIVGDDIAYLRKENGGIYAVNVERGIFGIVKDVNEKDDPLIWDALTREGEVIFSNVLVKDGVPRWQGDGGARPTIGVNYSGEWFAGKKDDNGEEIPFSHPNARYTIRLKGLANCDDKLEAPEGVEISGLIYGGRDSEAWPPVFESFGWEHGVVTIASSLESETTAATLGKVGIRKFNPMANLDFLSVPLEKYVRNHLDFGRGLERKTVIFGVNYFLRDEKGRFLTDMEDKRVWLKWMGLRVKGDVGAVRTAIGFLPEYDDLRTLFQQVLSKRYTRADYEKCFTLRAAQNLAKLRRVEKIFCEIEGMPEVSFAILDEQKRRLEGKVQ